MRSLRWTLTLLSSCAGSLLGEVEHVKRHAHKPVGIREAGHKPVGIGEAGHEAVRIREAGHYYGYAKDQYPERQQYLIEYVKEHNRLPDRYYPNEVVFEDQETLPHRTLAVHHRHRNTWREFSQRYEDVIDLRIMVKLLDADRYKRRVQGFSNRTRGLLSDEIHRAHMFGICQTPARPMCDKELGYCLESYLPYAYFAHLHGCLEASGGWDGTDAFYFFNSEHQILDPEEYKLVFTWQSFEQAHPMFREFERDKLNGLDPRGPTRASRAPSYGLVWPPFKDFYHNAFLKGIGKPIAIVGGKHTTEWSGPPMNTFADPVNLQPLLDTLLAHGYVVLYKRPAEALGEDSPYQQMLDPGDHQFIRDTYQGQDVILWQDLEAALLPLGTITSRVTLINVLMLSIYANAELFVMTQGGNGVIASLFDGDIFIYHAAGGECLEHNEAPLTDQYVYDRWTKHGGARFTVVNYHADLARNLAAYLEQKRLATLEFTD